MAAMVNPNVPGFAREHGHAARRQRRFRERRRRGAFMVPVEVTCEMVEALIKQGNLVEADARDLDCVGEAIAAAASRGL